MTLESETSTTGPASSPAPSVQGASAGPAAVDNAYLAALVHSSGEAMLGLSLDGIIESWNPAAERLFGYTAREIVGQHVRVLAPLEKRDEQREVFAAVERGETMSRETWRLAKDGRRVDVILTAGPVMGAGGEMVGVSATLVDISERKRAEAALHESEQRIRAIFDGTYEYIGLLSPDGTLLEANRASLEFARNTRADVVGRQFWRTPWFEGTPGAPEAMREWIARAAAGEFVRAEAQLIRPTGEATAFDISLHPVTGDDGEVAFIVPEGRDVTERRRVEDELRRSESRYRALFDAIDEGFCVLEMLFDEGGRPVDYRFVEANPAFVEQTGLVDAIGRTAREMVPDLERHWFEIYGKVATSRQPTRFESGSDAMGRWFDVYAFPIGEPEEHHVALLFKDITASRSSAAEKERLLRALEVERSRLAYVFQQAPAFLAVLQGPEHVFTLVNDAYYQLVGHRDLVGKPVREALPEVLDQGFIQLLDGVLETGEPFLGREVAVRLARTHGAAAEERFIDLTYLPVVEIDGSRSGIIAHGTDVTEQVLSRRAVERLLAESEQARAEAVAARSEAEAANRAKGDFLAVMSHELRTPLNAIGGYAELMEMGIRGPITKGQADDLRRIQMSQRHLLGLINEVLNYAKLETGAVHYDISDVSVRSALTAGESLVAPQARGRGLSLAVGDCDPGLTARADVEKVRQILVNLLSNAVKFTDKGGRIDVNAEGRDGDVQISVRDTGIGIPADRLPTIFDPFVQVRADLSRTHEGTGLGLAISRDLARGMGGDLLVESEEGVGSTFTLVLPRSTPATGPS
jgi:PAS domain S-box-containing protein